MDNTDYDKYDCLADAEGVIDALEAENQRLSAQVNELSGTFTTKESVLKDAERWQKHGKKMKFHFEEIRDGEYANHPLSLQAIAAEIIDAIDAAKEG